MFWVYLKNYNVGIAIGGVYYQCIWELQSQRGWSPTTWWCPPSNNLCLRNGGFYFCQRHCSLCLEEDRHSLDSLYSYSIKEWDCHLNVFYNTSTLESNIVSYVDSSYQLCEEMTHSLQGCFKILSFLVLVVAGIRR